MRPGPPPKPIKLTPRQRAELELFKTTEKGMDALGNNDSDLEKYERILLYHTGEFRPQFSLYTLTHIGFRAKLSWSAISVQDIRFGGIDATKDQLITKGLVEPKRFGNKVRNLSILGWILALGVAGIFPPIWPFEMPFTWIFLRYPNRVEIEHVVVRPGEPVNRFISSRESVLTMQTVSKMPDNPVPEF